MSDTADRVVLEGFRLFVRQVVREELAAQFPASPVAAEALISVGEGARRAGVTPATLRGWIRGGKLAGAKPPGTRGWRVRPSDLDAFMRQGPATGGPPHCAPIDLRAHRLASSITRGGSK